MAILSNWRVLLSKQEMLRFAQNDRLVKSLGMKIGQVSEQCQVSVKKGDDPGVRLRHCGFGGASAGLLTLRERFGNIALVQTAHADAAGGNATDLLVRDGNSKVYEGERP